MRPNYTCLLLLVVLLSIHGAELPKQQDYTPNIQYHRCGLNEFDCFPNESVPFCLPFEVVRDCIADCPNECGHNQTLCDANIKRSNSMCGKCVHNANLDKFCADRKWKNLCLEENVWQCATNQNCVHVSWLNDGEDDASDETRCSTKNCLEKSSSNLLVEHAPRIFSYHKPSSSTNSTESKKFKEFPCDCAELMQSNPKANSTQPQKAYDSRCYQSGQCSFSILCDFELYGGGWTVIMHRHWPPQIHFNRTWADYKTGFGTAMSGHEFWLGNDRLHSLTFGRRCLNELIIRMRTARQGSLITARYESIVVADETDAYKLTLGPLLTENRLFSSIDGMITARDRQFVTWNRQKRFCAQNPSGWWFPPDDCGQTALTSDFEAHRGYPGLVWGAERITEVTMFIRPRFYTPPIAGDV